MYLDFVAMSPIGKTDGVVILHACYSGPESMAEKALARSGIPR